MMTRMAAVAALLAATAGSPARAQAAPDTAGLARAVGAVLMDSVIPRLGAREPNYLLPPETAFDSAVAVALGRAPGMEPFPHGELTHGEWLGTHGYTLVGDTAAVRVEVGTRSREVRDLVDTYVEHSRWLFVRDPSGWRYVGHRFERGIDSGPVRG